MLKRTKVSAIASAALLIVGCGADVAQQQPQASTTSEALETSNGSSMNGSSMNGSSMNGSSMNGVSMNGVSMNGVSMNGSSMNGVSMNGSQLVGVDARGRQLLGEGMVGARFVGQRSDGGTVPLRVDSATTGAGSNSDVWFYGVSYQNSAGWQPLCGLDATTGKPVLAVAVLGTWDSRQGVPGGGSYTYSADTISFGCHAMGAIAKCVELGYKPWKDAPDGSGSLRQHHVACTRLIRADYCGDGQSHTINGRLIDVFDGVGVQSPSRDGLLALWLLEGEWSPDGARCISPLINDRYVKANLSVPKCLLSLISLTCGAKAHFAAGPVIMNRDKLY